MARSPQGTFSNLSGSLRPGQWTKNLLVFAALIFGQRLGDPSSVGAAVLAFLVFCALPGAVYLVNDVLDREQDRRHPLKRAKSGRKAAPAYAKASARPRRSSSDPANGGGPRFGAPL